MLLLSVVLIEQLEHQAHLVQDIPHYDHTLSISIQKAALVKPVLYLIRHVAMMAGFQHESTFRQKVLQ